MRKTTKKGTMAIIGALGLIVVSCGRREPAVSHSASLSADPFPTPVAAAEPWPGAPGVTTDAVPVLPVPVACEVAGHVSELRAEPGAPVRHGEIVAVLDTGNEMAVSRASLAEAEAALRSARTNYLKQVQLRETGQPAPGDEESARVAMETAARNRNRALRYVQAVQREDNKRWIRSPADGRVESILVRSNQSVSAGQSLLTILSVDPPPDE